MKNDKKIEEGLVLSGIIGCAVNEWGDFCEECHKEGYSPTDTLEERIADSVLAAGYRKQSKPFSCGHEKGSEWISVEERLPEIGDSYIVVVKEKYKIETDYRYHVDVASFVFVGGYIDDVWDTFNDWHEGQEECHVTHWMPLPEPPKMKGGEGE